MLNSIKNDTRVEKTQKQVRLKDEAIFEAYLTFFYKNNYLTEGEVSLIRRMVEEDKRRVEA